MPLALKSAGADGQFGTGDDVTVATTTTAADGTYYFTNVDPGTYIVDVTTPPAGYTLITGAQSNTDPTAPITVAAGQVYLDADFGYRNTSLYSITDKVWYDANRDGLVSPGETGIAGVSVNLYQDLNGDGNVTAHVINGLLDLNGDGNVTAADDGTVAQGIKVIGGKLDLNGNNGIDTGDDGAYMGFPSFDGMLDMNRSGGVGSRR